MPSSPKGRGPAPVSAPTASSFRLFRPSIAPALAPRGLLLATTALIAVASLALPALADSGVPCGMQNGSCVISTNGTNGANGADGGDHDRPGFDGTPGTPAGDVTSDIEDATNLVSNGATSAINITAVGGNSGSGGNAGNYGPGTLWHNRGGNGQPGQDGGALNITIGPATSGSASGGPVGVPTSAVTIISAGGTGGGGGLATEEEGSDGNGISAVGGSGKAVTATVGGQWNSSSGAALYAGSWGGTGGTANNSSANYIKFAPDGGIGGTGGQVDITVTGNLTGLTYGALAISQGGAGGGGGNGTSEDGSQGGDGGNGGAAGNATVTLAAGAQVLSTNASAAALYVASIGGVGGAGGGGDSAIGGNAGVGGAAANAAAVVNGTVYTSGLGNSYGVLVQSLGGYGGNGGHSSDWFNPTSGDGAMGGIAGTATVTGTGAAIQTGQSGSAGDNETAVLAQSIGGGGGVGPDSKDGWFAIGGNGGNAVAGDKASAVLSNSTVETFGFGSAGIAAQSIGGGGGKGGDATKSTGVIVNMVIGGTGGAGGDARDAFAANDGGAVTTHNDHAPGVMMQSVGGGGGNGGAGYGTSYSGFYGGSISVGGNGGKGGNGGTANGAIAENNSGRIVTTGSDSFGILGQSIGGGGGSGGASTAKSVVRAVGDYPGMSLSLATGGSGATGGAGNTVYLQSSGLIATSGLGAIGMLGQSVGGGGGSGGDASGSSAASKGGYNFSASVTHGGSAAGGGNGGDATALNNGLIITSGEAADGILVQSIGGGGGNGGSGDSKSSTGADKSLSLTLTMGGSGGAGGQGFQVNATNAGSILTLGDGANGVAAQTIGGGGGRAGGAAASNSGTITGNVAIGGRGGNGGDTFYNGSFSQVTNSGTITTFGADANGILAQSIGGGGGAGGKAGTSMGDGKSNNDGSNGAAGSVSGTTGTIAQNFAANGASAMSDYDEVAELLVTTNQLLGNVSSGVGDDDPGDAADETAGSGGKTDDDNETKKTSLSVALGGNGGLGGAGGIITVTNTGAIATMGKHSDAIVVQSIGGGGGKGGAASTATSADYSGSVAIGGNSNGSGKNQNSDNGGQAFANNSGQVFTVGALSNAIIAQSIGGGGGIGGSSTATTTGTDGKKTASLNISLGGSATPTGISESAQVTNTAAIQTRGHDSYGIIAQSIAGGGGLVKTLATDLDNAGGSATASSTKDFAANIKLGGTGGSNSSRNSGSAYVKTSGVGTITTRGDNGVGILAQSVSAGGGLAQGGKPNGSTAADFLGTASRTGSVNPGLSTDGNVNTGVIVDVGANIATAGAGGFGVFAQSVGGGGGIAGDLGHTMEKANIGRASNHSGNGGDILVTLEQGASITTTGGNAPGIVAQTVGGGGGWFTNDALAYIGSAGGTGIGGLITVDVGGIVDAQGAASVGVFAQSTGGSDNGGTGDGHQVAINVGSASNTAAQVWGGNGFGDDAAAIYIRNGSKDAANPDTLTNYGAIATHDTNMGTAVFSSGATFAGTNYGSITGNVHLATGSITNQGSGTITPYQTLSLGDGKLVNFGTLDLTHKAPVTTLEGDYEGRAGSRIVLGADFVNGAADRIEVTGDAVLGGSVEIRPSALSKGTVEIARVAGTLTLGDTFGATDTALFRYDLVRDGGSLSVASDADFVGAAQGLGRNRQAVAEHLQGIWDDGGSLGGGFTSLAAVGDAQVPAALDTIAGQAFGLIGASRYQASLGFIDTIWAGCDANDAPAERCAWVKMTGTRGTMDGTRDSLGYDTKSTGFRIGGAQAISEQTSLGAALAYENLSADDENGFGHVSGDAVQLAGYANWQSGEWRLSAAAELAYGWFDTSRDITLGWTGADVTGSTNSWHAGLHGRAAWHKEMGGSYIEPRLDVSLLHIRTDGFAERGNSPFALSVDEASDTTLIATPALAIGGDLAVGNGSTLRLSGSIGYSMMSDSVWAPTARLVSGPEGFVAETALPDRLWKVGLEATMIGAGNTSLSAAYRGEIGSGYDSHTVELRLDYRF